MLLALPAQFHIEVLRSSEEEISDLKMAGRTLLQKGKSDQQIIKALSDAGWSPLFSTWYTSQLRSYPDFDLQYAPQIDPEQAARENKLATKRKSKMRNLGLLFYALSYLQVGVLVLIASTLNMDQNAITAVAVFISIPLFLFLHVRGLFNICDSKGISRWYSLGSLAIFMPDSKELGCP